MKVARLARRRIERSRRIDELRAHAARYASAIADARIGGEASFQNWFDDAESVKEAVAKGFWDFSVHVLTPTVAESLQQPGDLRALEIGCGGGRLLNAACCYFQDVIGIDVHGELDQVERFLHDQGKDNFTLRQTAGNAIPADDATVDLVYSFIVFQHLSRWQDLRSYLEESWRCLKPGGVAQLYFGHLKRLTHPLRGYVEIAGPVNDTSLLVSPRLMKRAARSQGFRILDCGRSYRPGPGGYRHRSGFQRYITLRKPSTVQQ